MLSAIAINKIRLVKGSQPNSQRQPFTNLILLIAIALSISNFVRTNHEYESNNLCKFRSN